MNIKFILSIILLSSFYSCFSQVTHLENYYEGQGGIEGIYYPNYIILDSSDKNLYISASNCITHLVSDSTYSEFSFIESVTYSSDSLPGLWNVDEIALTKNNKFFYVSGDNQLLCLSQCDSTGKFVYNQKFVNNDTMIIGYALLSDIALSQDNHNLYLASTHGFRGGILIFDIDSLNGNLTLKRRIDDIADIKSIICSNNNQYMYCSINGYENFGINVYERFEEKDSLVLIQELTADDSILSPGKLIESYDGKNIYVCDDKCIAVFDIDQITGELSFNQRINIDDLFNGFMYGRDIIISNDNSNLYLTGPYSLSVFARDKNTGKLTFRQVIKEEDFQFSCFDGLSSIKLTSNDSVIFITSEYNNSILIFKRDILSGLLTYQNKITDGDGKIRGLSLAKEITVSHDNKYIYTLAHAGSEIIGIYEKSDDGYLKFIRTVKWEELGPAVGATYLFEVTPDDNYLFVSSTDMYGIRILKRDINNGDLLFYKSYTGADIGIDETISDFTITADQNHLYVSTYSSIITYSINPDNADITFLSSMFSDNNMFGIEGINSIITSKDGKNVYTSSSSPFIHDGISVYSRNENDGSINHLQSVIYEADSITKFKPVKIILSPDNNFLYSIGPAIHCFERDINNGNLYFKHQINFEDLGSDNINSLSDASISADGKSFIGVTNRGKSIVSFSRNKSTGYLIFEQCKHYSDNTEYSLLYGPKICITQDLKNAYLISQYDKLLAANKVNLPVGLFDNITICKGDMLSIDEDYSYLWSTGDTTNYIYITDEGEYSVYVTDSIGREGWDTTTVNFYPTPIIDLGPDTTVCLKDTVILYSNISDVENYEYFWNDSSTVFYKTVLCSDYGIGEHLFILMVTNQFGCSSTDSIKINITEASSIKEGATSIANIYPNPSSGEITVEPFDNYLISLYDCSGKIIFKDQRIVDNTINIKYLPKGIYFLKIVKSRKYQIHKIIKY
ncbi:MAG: beta-propeller fold lactonase family protein [Bacteroidales bacterium]|nr:beta-propeller fold lactonase family protein [Bacteroidales bacterium]